MGVRCEGVKGDDRRLRLFLLPPCRVRRRKTSAPQTNYILLNKLNFKKGADHLDAAGIQSAPSLDALFFHAPHQHLHFRRRVRHRVADEEEIR